MKRCAICRTTRNIELHHLLCGTQRKAADKYGLTINLCHSCHRKVHDTPELMTASRKAGQRKFERTYSRQDFIRIFGKNYLED